MPVPHDAIPDRGTVRVSLLLAARDPLDAHLGEELAAGSSSIIAAMPPEVDVQVLTHIDDDPFPAANPGGRAMDAVLVVEGPTAAVGTGRIGDALVPVLRELRPSILSDASGVMVGWPQPIIAGPPARLRYLYLMRRRADLAPDAYVDHYFHRHSAFGFHLGGIRSYTQVHADLAATAALGEQLELTSAPYDSISELQFDSIDEFFQGVTAEAAEASNDELVFVDRDRSISFCTTEVR
jgi:hypothetical protein